jgi:hypothetical protein
MHPRVTWVARPRWCVSDRARSSRSSLMTSRRQASSPSQAHRHEVDAHSLSPPWRSAGIRTQRCVRHLADVTNEQAWRVLRLVHSPVERLQHALWPLVGRQPPPGGGRQWDEPVFSNWPVTPSALRRRANFSAESDEHVDDRLGHGKRYGPSSPRSRQGIVRCVQRMDERHADLACGPQEDGRSSLTAAGSPRTP